MNIIWQLEDYHPIHMNNLWFTPVSVWCEFSDYLFLNYEQIANNHRFGCMCVYLLWIKFTIHIQKFMFYYTSVRSVQNNDLNRIISGLSSYSQE